MDIGVNYYANVILPFEALVENGMFERSID